jgi:hypothetical protein
VGVSPAGSGVLAERTFAAHPKTATQDASLGGQDADPTRELWRRSATDYFKSP